MYDILIKNGRIVDGSGNPAFRGDVLIKDGKIVDVGRLAAQIPDEKIEDIIDVDGKVVAPGFIDPHTHEEVNIFADPVLGRYLYQGVTTVIDGHCGSSIFTTSELTRQYPSYFCGHLPEDVKWDSLSEYAQVCQDRGGLGFNHGVLLGHGTLRWAAMGGAKQRPAHTGEMETMRRMIMEGLEQGALGMSTGLGYVPGKAAPTWEVERLCQELTLFNATYATHTRAEHGRAEGTAEAIRIGRTSGVCVHVSHLDPNSATEIAWLEAASREGIEAACDVMPHSGGHVIRLDVYARGIKSSHFEHFDMSLAEFKALLKDKDFRSQIIAKSHEFRLPKDELILVNCTDPEWEGRSLQELASESGKDANHFFLELMAEERPAGAIWQYAYRRNQTNRNRFPVLKDVITSPVVTCGSDSIMTNPADPFEHYELQRNGVFPTFLVQGREAGASLEYNIQRITALPARQFRLWDRGMLRPGMAADIVVFAPERFLFPEEIIPQDPHVLAQGMNKVLVNGTIVLSDGKLTGATPGKILLGKGRRE